MSINFQHLAPIIAASVSTGGIIFQIGRQSERLESIGFKGEAQEKKHSINSTSINDMNQKLTLLVQLLVLYFQKLQRLQCHQD